MTACHPINLVIDDNGRDIEITPGSMDKMITANCSGITISHNCQYCKFRIGKLDAAGIGDAAAVETVESARGEVLIGETRTADVADDDDRRRIDGKFHDVDSSVLAFEIAARPRLMEAP